MKKPFLTLEFFALMIVLPLVLYAALPMKYLLPTIWVAGLYAYAISRVQLGHRFRVIWNAAAVTRTNLTPILKRFALCVVLMTGFTLAYAPDQFLSFPRERTPLWLLVMCFYPLLSVVPQEIIFRSFFFDRYSALFTTRRAMLLASGLAFAFAHLLFHNWIAPTLCLIGGLMFAGTYARHRSLALVALEHALYGDALFTLGLGRYFYHGSVAASL